MADNTHENNPVANAINSISTANLSTEAIHQSTAGKAYSAMALSSAIAVQDATNHLRNIETLTTSATAAALSKAIDNGNTEALSTTLAEIQTLLINSQNNFKIVAADAREILKADIVSK